MFRETGAAVAVDGARKAWYFSSGVVVLGVAVGLAMFCAYLVISLGLDLLAVRRDLMRLSFPQSAWIAVVVKVPIAVASFWLARKFALQTYRLWNVASSPAETELPKAGVERAKQAGALRLGLAAREAGDAGTRESPVPGVAGAALPSPARRMAELKDCLDAGLISSAEYEAKRAEILRSL